MTDIIRIRAEQSTRLHQKETHEMLWKKCVSQAKLLIVGRNMAKAMICDLAYKACDLQRGGGGHWSGFKDQYTASKFAGEVGVHPKTLLNWLLLYRAIYLKLPARYQNNSFNWSVAHEVRRITLSSSVKDKDVLIKKTYDKIVNLKPTDRIKVNVSSYCGSIHSNISKMKNIIDLKETKQVLENLINIIDEKIEVV